jgi:hypothetical protein
MLLQRRTSDYQDRHVAVASFVGINQQKLACASEHLALPQMLTKISVYSLPIATWNSGGDHTSEKRMS